jgi:hypothetical protein
MASPSRSSSVAGRAVGVFEQGLELGDLGLLVGVHDERAEVIVDVDAQPRPRLLAVLSGSRRPCPACRRCDDAGLTRTVPRYPRWSAPWRATRRLPGECPRRCSRRCLARRTLRGGGVPLPRIHLLVQRCARPVLSIARSCFETLAAKPRLTTLNPAEPLACSSIFVKCACSSPLPKPASLTTRAAWVFPALPAGPCQPSP